MSDPHALHLPLAVCPFYLLSSFFSVAPSDIQNKSIAFRFDDCDSYTYNSKKSPTKISCLFPLASCRRRDFWSEPVTSITATLIHQNPKLSIFPRYTPPPQPLPLRYPPISHSTTQAPNFTYSINCKPAFFKMSWQGS